ncbi:hypothetical protein M405DRAFT_862084 [Rhizopogon salebrosus TDB-379]|nr:hypothetical protein M405DRAFT_862084 [Rhizopogon salebrosus TDB-379]
MGRIKKKLGSGLSRSIHLRPAEIDAVVTVVELDPSYVGHELKHATLLGARRYDEPILAFKGMLSKLDNIVNVQIRDLRQQYFSPSGVGDVILNVIRAELENVPHRLLNTSCAIEKHR